MKNEIFSILPGDHPWAEHLHIEECLPSTNQTLKTLASNGAAEGTTVIAREQTAGRGRLGRSFYSQKDTGLYFSCLLRPQCVPQELMHLTCAVGVAVCSAIEKAAGVLPQIKWINDLVLGRKKLGGILTELSIDPQTGLVDYAIIGIGINCLQPSFPEELSQIATSLFMKTQKPCSPARVAAYLIEELERLSKALISQKDSYMNRYRDLCVTLGKEVKVITGEKSYEATATGIGEDGCLIVQLPDGGQRTVSSGEASVRGLFGYL